MSDSRVLEAMETTPRHTFVQARFQALAYHDMALPIGSGQTISPPSMVAAMLDRLDLAPEHRVLEVGTGTGYQAAVLSRLVAEVFTIEILPSLARTARSTLKDLGLVNVHVRTGDGYAGWPAQGPFDRIIVACSPEAVPAPLIEQLREGGKLIVPLGSGYDQVLYLLTKTHGVLKREAVAPIAFVPMTGRAELDREQAREATGPVLRNGGFEEVEPGTGRAKGWYHQRQVAVLGDAAPEGRRYAAFENHTTGRTSQASQALALDGRQTRSLVVSGWVRGGEIQRGPDVHSQASLALAFYNSQRELVSGVILGDWSGTFDWEAFEYAIEVPTASREAILRIGLNGATGVLAVDGLRLAAEP